MDQDQQDLTLSNSSSQTFSIWKPPNAEETLKQGTTDDEMPQQNLNNLSNLSESGFKTDNEQMQDGSQNGIDEGLTTPAVNDTIAGKKKDALFMDESHVSSLTSKADDDTSGKNASTPVIKNKQENLEETLLQSNSIETSDEKDKNGLSTLQENIPSFTISPEDSKMEQDKNQVCPETEQIVLDNNNISSPEDQINGEKIPIISSSPLVSDTEHEEMPLSLKDNFVDQQETQLLPSAPSQYSSLEEWVNNVTVDINKFPKPEGSEISTEVDDKYGNHVDKLEISEKEAEEHISSHLGELESKEEDKDMTQVILSSRSSYKLKEKTEDVETTKIPGSAEETEDVISEAEIAKEISSQLSFPSTKPEEEQKKGAVSLANVSRFWTKKKPKETSGTDEEDETDKDDASAKSKEKKKGALAHVSRFLTRTVKKDKVEQEDILKNLDLSNVSVPLRRDSDELSYSEEREDIPPQLLKTLATTKLEVQNIASIISHVSRGLEIAPPIVTYVMVKEMEELKQRVDDLIKTIPDNITMINSLESEESQKTCKDMWQTIRQELEAMSLLANVIHNKLVKRRT